MCVCVCEYMCVRDREEVVCDLNCSLRVVVDHCAHAAECRVLLVVVVHLAQGGAPGLQEGLEVAAHLPRTPKPQPPQRDGCHRGGGQDQTCLDVNECL